MTTGEGGMITTNNADLADRIRLLRSHGMTSLTWDRSRGHGFSYDVVSPGYNYRIDEIRSAIGLVQMQKLADNNQQRLEITNIYKERLGDIEEISLPFFHAQSLSAYHIFPIVLNRSTHREHFMRFMRDKGIQTSIHYPPVHTFTAYAFCRQNCRVPLTEDIGAREVTLPLYASMSREQVEYVITSIKAWAVSAK
jgi:dTDP-4-amino-4,6-dideoxygalactose transaminase